MRPIYPYPGVQLINPHTPDGAPADAAWVIARLEDAGLALLALPNTGPSTRLVQGGHGMGPQRRRELWRGEDQDPSGRTERCQYHADGPVLSLAVADSGA